MKRAVLKDHILKFLIDHFGEHPHFIDVNEIALSLDQDKMLIWGLCRQMERMKHVQEVNNESIRITAEGQAFLELDGGYIAEFEKEQEIINREENVARSVMSTNSSVEMTNENQLLLLRFTILISLISLVISILTFFKDDRIVINPTPGNVYNKILLPSGDTVKTQTIREVSKAHK